MKKVIKVANRFPFPGPRFIRLGPQSGEEFKEYLIKEINKTYPNGYDGKGKSLITIDLDGTQGYGSSFLEEGFGGLIRANVPYEIVNSLILISDEEPELIEEIKDYINIENEKIMSSGCKD
ncbi:TPA: STAS-like domain-containing protein [Yersinia enterocolitica]|nr:STAS-like domain-containing protein [Yersinia enterocolitica]HEI6823284.1 STAS-like domain-containing protein [Yersinia enterocolitica]HEI6882414.1 STAS-like domain-containing protein [Yersinia enterocolitica]